MMLMETMNLHDISAAILAGNLMTLCVVYGFQQFVRHDYKAPLLAYAACLMPILYLLASFYQNSH
jgi:hypothetical protein